MGASSLFENTSKRLLVIPFMSAAARPSHKPHRRHQSSSLFDESLLFCRLLYYFLVCLLGRSRSRAGAGSSRPPPSRQRGSSLRVGPGVGPEPAAVKRRLEAPQIPQPVPHHKATKITIITWTVCQVTSLPPLPSWLESVPLNCP